MWPGASSRLRAASDSAGISRFRGAVRVESAILCFKRDAATCDAALFQPDLRGASTRKLKAAGNLPRVRQRFATRNVSNQN